MIEKAKFECISELCVCVNFVRTVSLVELIKSFKIQNRKCLTIEKKNNRNSLNEHTFEYDSAEPKYNNC